MAFQKKLAFQAFIDRNHIDAADMPKWLQAALRLFYQDYAAAGNKLTDELTTRADELAEGLKEWFEDEEPEPAPTAPAPDPTPVVATDPLTAEQVLMQLHGQSKTKVTAAQLKEAGFTPKPGPTGGTWGKYRLTKALFSSTYILKKI